MNKVQRKFIIDALEYSDHLSEWENEFINNLSERKDDYELTEKQNKVLNRIADKVNNI